MVLRLLMDSKVLGFLTAYRDEAERRARLEVRQQIRFDPIQIRFVQAVRAAGGAERRGGADGAASAVAGAPTWRRPSVSCP